jgi:hypothetical protein
MRKGVLVLLVLVAPLFASCNRNKKTACTALHARIDAVEGIHLKAARADSSDFGIPPALAKDLNAQKQELSALQIDDSKLRDARDFYETEINNEAGCYELISGDSNSGRLSNWSVHAPSTST